MRALALLPLAACALIAAAPAVAATPRQPAPPPAPVAPPAPSPADAEIALLRQRLLASQQTVSSLEQQLGEEKAKSVALGQCRVKNGRLVKIGRVLIEAYDRRYRETHHDPLQLGRRQFEIALQNLSDAVYDASVDIPAPVPGSPAPVAPPAATPAKTPDSATQAQGN